MSTMNRSIALLAIGSMTMGLGGCQTMDEHRTATGAIGGAVLGGVAGALIDGNNPWRGAAIGAAAGAAVGGGIGYMLQKQKDSFDRIEALEARERTVYVNEPVEKVGPDGAITTEMEPVEKQALTVTMGEELLFGKDSATLTPAGDEKLGEVAEVLREYAESDVIINGYASEDGGEKYNVELSERRANAVRNTLIRNRVNPNRLIALGHGTANAIADNSTAYGRAKNRRVELDIIPREEIK